MLVGNTPLLDFGFVGLVDAMGDDLAVSRAAPVCVQTWLELQEQH